MLLPITYDIHYLFGLVFFPLTFLASLQLGSPSKTSLPNRGVCEVRPAPLWVPRSTWFSSQFSHSHRGGAGISAPFLAPIAQLKLPACRFLYTQFHNHLVTPLQHVCACNSLRLLIAKLSPCSRPTSDPRLATKPFRKAPASLLHGLLTRCILTNSSVLRS